MSRPDMEKRISRFNALKPLPIQNPSIPEKARDVIYSRELLSVIDDESERLARLVDDLLDVSRIQAGAVNPRTDWTDLADVTANSAASVRARLGEHPIEFDLPPDLPLVQADAAQLERVFANLIENAIRYSPPDQPVRISGGAGGGKVVVRVTDRGAGIPPALKFWLFS